jgi:hypothetical protein
VAVTWSLGDAFGNPASMLAVLVKDFAGAFSSSGKCSVMLVPARSARRPSAQLVPFVRSSVDLVVLSGERLPKMEGSICNRIELDAPRACEYQ